MISKSNLFYSNKNREIENKIKKFLNGQTNFLSPRTIDSPRAVGDAIQNVLADNFERIMGNYGINYSSSFARRAMADLAFKDKNDFYYIVDVKTHRIDSSFNMPNLTSVERLSRFYEDDLNYFVVLKIDYKTQKNRVLIDKVTFAPIEFFSWDCLTLGALGWGQIQIANSSNVNIIQKNSRKKWMLELCNNLFEFYPREIGKINNRIIYFKKVKKYWKNKKE